MATPMASSIIALTLATTRRRLIARDVSSECLTDGQIQSQTLKKSRKWQRMITRRTGRAVIALQLIGRRHAGAHAIEIGLAIGSHWRVVIRGPTRPAIGVVPDVN